MSDHATVEDQLSELKDFFKKYWLLIVLVLVIGLASVWGWRYWKSYQNEQLEKASDTYELLISKLSPEQPESITELVTFSNNNDNIYGVFSALKSAQYYVEVLNDYAGAQGLLESAAKKVEEDSILSIINIRIARLQYQQENYQDSLKSLATVTDESWAPVVNDVRGDVYVALAQYTEACDAYQKALDFGASEELSKNIKMKLNEAQFHKAQQDADNQSKAVEAAKEAERLAVEEAKRIAEEAEKVKTEQNTPDIAPQESTNEAQ